MPVAVLHHLPETADPYGIVATLMAAAPSGSYLVISHPAKDIDADAVAVVQKRYNERVAAGQVRRTREEVATFLAGLDLIGPGITQTVQWRPEPGGALAERAGADVGGGRPEAVARWAAARWAAARVGQRRPRRS